MRDSLGPWSGLRWGRRQQPALPGWCVSRNWARRLVDSAGRKEAAAPAQSQTCCAAWDPKVLSTSSLQPLGQRCKLQPNHPGPGINFLWVGFPSKAEKKALEGSQGGPHPSHDGLGGKWGSVGTVGFREPPRAWPCCRCNVAPSLPTQRSGHGKAWMGTGVGA